MQHARKPDSTKLAAFSGQRRALVIAALGATLGVAPTLGCSAPPRPTPSAEPPARSTVEARRAPAESKARPSEEVIEAAHRSSLNATLTRSRSGDAPRTPRRVLPAAPISALEAEEAAADARMVSAAFAFMGDQGGSRLLRTDHPLWTHGQPGDQSLADLIQRRCVDAILLELLDEQSHLTARLVIRLTYSDRPLAVKAFDLLAFRRRLAAAGARIQSASELRIFLDASERPPYCTDEAPSPIPPELADLPLGEVWCTGRISASCEATVFILIEP